MTLRTATTVFVMLAFSLGHAWPTRAQEALMAECNGEAKFARIVARDRDAGVPSEKVITTINEQGTWTPDDKLRMTGLATMIYGNRGLTPDQWASEVLVAPPPGRAVTGRAAPPLAARQRPQKP